MMQVAHATRDVNRQSQGPGKVLRGIMMRRPPSAFLAGCDHIVHASLKAELRDDHEVATRRAKPHKEDDVGMAEAHSHLRNEYMNE